MHEVMFSVNINLKLSSTCLCRNPRSNTDTTRVLIMHRAGFRTRCKTEAAKIQLENFKDAQMSSSSDEPGIPLDLVIAKKVTFGRWSELHSVLRQSNRITEREGSDTGMKTLQRFSSALPGNAENLYVTVLQNNQNIQSVPYLHSYMCLD